MLETSASIADVAAKVGAYKQAVRSLRRRYEQTGTTDDLP